MPSIDCVITGVRIGGEVTNEFSPGGMLCTGYTARQSDQVETCTLACTPDGTMRMQFALGDVRLAIETRFSLYKSTVLWSSHTSGTGAAEVQVQTNTVVQGSIRPGMLSTSRTSALFSSLEELHLQQNEKQIRILIRQCSHLRLHTCQLINRDDGRKLIALQNKINMWPIHLSLQSKQEDMRFPLDPSSW